MEQELIQKKVEQVFIRVFGPGTVVTPDTPAGEINGWDSMNHVILIRELEKEFGIEIDLFDALEITGVDAIFTIIGNKLNG